jgi:hypothetical protein
MLVATILKDRVLNGVSKLTAVLLNLTDNILQMVHFKVGASSPKHMA